MTRNTTGVSISESTIEDIDNNFAAAGFHSRSAFIRAAVEDKLDEIQDAAE